MRDIYIYMGRGNKYYNKETERARQINQSFKKKHTGKIKQNLCEKIHGKEETELDLKLDVFNLYKNASNNLVIIREKNKLITRLSNIIFKDDQKTEELCINLFNNFDNFEIFVFNSDEEAIKFCYHLEENNKCLFKIGYELPKLEYYTLNLKNSDEVGVFINKQYLNKVRRIK